MHILYLIWWLLQVGVQVPEYGLCWKLSSPDMIKRVTPSCLHKTTWNKKPLQFLQAGTVRLLALEASNLLCLLVPMQGLPWSCCSTSRGVLLMNWDIIPVVDPSLPTRNQTLLATGNSPNAPIDRCFFYVFLMKPHLYPFIGMSYGRVWLPEAIWYILDYRWTKMHQHGYRMI